MPKVFISYRRDDSIGLAGRIYDRLAAHFGPDSVFMDVNAIPLGVDFRQYVPDAVNQCDVLLAVIGESWLGLSRAGQRRLDDPTDFVRIEIEIALRRGILVIPVVIAPGKMPKEAELPEPLRELAYRNALEVDPGRDFHSHLDRLIRGIAPSTPGSVSTTPTGVTRGTAAAPATVTLIDASLDPYDSPYEQVIEDGKKVIRPKSTTSRNPSHDPDRRRR
jgi:hypothetical protein